MLALPRAVDCFAEMLVGVIASDDVLGRIGHSPSTVPRTRAFSSPFIHWTFCTSSEFNVYDSACESVTTPSVSVCAKFS